MECAVEPEVKPWAATVAKLPGKKLGFAAEPELTKSAQTKHKPKKSPVVAVDVVSTSKTKTSSKSQIHLSAPNKEINPPEVVKSQTFLGCDFFGTSYLAFYIGSC